MVNKAGEECERELEQEEEQEKEEEQVTPRQNPKAEADWDYHSIFNYHTAVALARRIHALKLRDAISQHFKSTDCLGSIKWDLGGEIFLTRNFIETIIPPEVNKLVVAEYLRPVNALLVFKKTGGVVMLSEREADAILKLMHQRPRAHNNNVMFVNLSYLRAAHNVEGGAGNDEAWSPGQHVTRHVPLQMLVCLQLFAGETKFETTEQKECLNRIIGECASARAAALRFPAMRGQQFMVPISDLDVACK